MAQKYDDFFDQLIRENNGYLHISMLETYGIDRAYVYPYIRAKKMKKIARGTYCRSGMSPDMMFVVCKRNSAAIISHLSAAYVHGLIQEEPETVSVTVPQGYNAMHLTDRWIKVFQINRDGLLLGKMSVIDAAGNQIRIYDTERTVCDLIREREYQKHEGEDRINEAIRTYFAPNTERNIKKLSEYANAMDIYARVRSYVTLFL